MALRRPLVRRLQTWMRSHGRRFADDTGGGPRRHGQPEARKSTSAVGTVLPVRPGAVWKLQ